MQSSRICIRNITKCKKDTEYVLHMLAQYLCNYPYTVHQCKYCMQPHTRPSAYSQLSQITFPQKSDVKKRKQLNPDELHHSLVDG